MLQYSHLHTELSNELLLIHTHQNLLHMCHPLFYINYLRTNTIRFRFILILFLKSAKLCVLCSLVPYVPRAWRDLVRHMPGILQTLMPHFFCALHALVPHLSFASPALVPHVHRALHALTFLWFIWYIECKFVIVKHLRNTSLK